MKIVVELFNNSNTMNKVRSDTNTPLSIIEELEDDTVEFLKGYGITTIEDCIEWGAKLPEDLLSALEDRGINLK